MSMILDNNMMEQGGFFQRSKSKFRPSILGDRRVVNDCSSSSSSSIGVNSDNDDQDEEVESKFKKNEPFDSAIDALEQALPIRRGISNFYNGKSKSFTSLAETASSSIKDITKPENAYSRKRKRLLAYSLLYDKGNKTSMLKSPGIGGGISKKPTNNGRSTLALAVAMNNCEGRIDHKGLSGHVNMNDNSKIPSVSSPLTPWRSFSLVDLQQCGVSVGGLKSNLCSQLMGERSKRDEVS